MRAALRTLVIIVKSSCTGCQASKPFLARLVTETRGIANSRVALLVAQIELEERAFARDIGLTEQEVHSLDLNSLKVQRVPTMVVVDSRGTIRFAHEDPPTTVDDPRLLAVFREALK